MQKLVGKKGQVHAFEPQSMLFQYLEKMKPITNPIVSIQLILAYTHLLCTVLQLKTITLILNFVFLIFGERRIKHANRKKQ
jgi:hypothetical protein